MMESLVNYSLVTNEISLINHHITGETFSVDPQIHRKIDRLDDTKTAVTYVLDIKNTPDHPFPIDLVVSLTGVFDISNLKEKDIDDFLKVQSCQIVFPHIRSIVATLTASALMPPFLLPIIDARKVFDESKPKDDSK